MGRRRIGIIHESIFVVVGMESCWAQNDATDTSVWHGEHKGHHIPIGGVSTVKGSLEGITFLGRGKILR